MKRTISITAALALLGSLLAALPGAVTAAAQEAGGPVRIVARILADMLSMRWSGRPVIVENRPGAGTIVATAALAKAPPDGATFMLATNSFVINPALNMKLPYDTTRDFDPISMVATQPVALVATKSFPADTLAELIAMAKQAPEALNYTSPGPRGVGHLAGKMLQQRAGFMMNHISYNGSAPALTDVIAGRVPLIFDIWHSARRYVDSGDLKLIAGAGSAPLPGAESTPTIAATFPGFNVIAFNAAVGPAGIAPAVLDKLSGDIRAVVDSPQFAARTRSLGIDAWGNNPAALDAWMRTETAKWAQIAREGNLKLE